jgi:hypothetical protein
MGDGAARKAVVEMMSCDGAMIDFDRRRRQTALMSIRPIPSASMCAPHRVGFGVVAQMFVLLEIPH